MGRCCDGRRDSRTDRDGKPLGSLSRGALRTPPTNRPPTAHAALFELALGVDVEDVSAAG